jgi:hypothetical protein
MGRQHLRRVTGARKSTLTEKDRRILRRVVSKNHATTAAELNIHLEDPVSTKTARRDVSFINPTSTIGLQDFSKLARIHSKKDCGCIEGKIVPAPY